MPAAAQAGVHKGTLGTSLATVGAAVATGKLQRVSYIRACNTTATARTIDVGIHDGSNTHYLAKGLTVLPYESVNIAGAATFLPAGYSLKALAAAGSAIDLTAPYLETDA